MSAKEVPYEDFVWLAAEAAGQTERQAESMLAAERAKADRAAMKAPQFTLSDSGRLLLRGTDYDPMVDAIDADRAFMQRIADLLNQHGEG
jgi:hypothetical protein